MLFLVRAESQPRPAVAANPLRAPCPLPLLLVSPRPKSPTVGPPRPSHVALPRVPQPPLLQKSQPPPSMFEDAGRVLRRVQHHRRVMEENVEAVLRAKGAEALYCQLGALSCNRGAAEELRIKKTVDAWISTLSKEVQADIRREDFLARKAEGDKGGHGDSPQMDGGAKGGARLLREAKGRARTTGKNPFQREPQRHDQNVKVQHTCPEPSLKTRGPHPLRPFGVSKSEREGEEYLMKVYGKALYDGHRRTLKKAPYLRYSSPSPKSKPQRPRVVESVKGVKMKSAKTQTSLVPQRTHTVVNEPQYTFSPTAGGTMTL
ncbi:hypothetical protein AAFF_G00412270 [Aldrovandia affinis]|uniref:Uncharacterized protein n=1 Tax=Aldrovandia affinis TaxID=143900 RepID=A0AAD7SBF5_9TELE|nr:hypothetical protein AAFF_G00412270 [Aldrovandia affinis]